MKTILVPTDFSAYSTNALFTAVAIVKPAGGEIILQHNIPTLLTRWEALSETEKMKHPEVIISTNEALVKLQDLSGSGLFKDIPVKKVITYGVTSDEIIRQSKQENVDVIVMGSHGNTAAGKDFIASTTQRVIRESSRPVLAVKKEKRDVKWNKVVLPDTFDFDISKPFGKVRKIVQALGSTIQLLYINTPDNFKNTEEIHLRMKAFEMRYPELKFERAIYDHPDVEKGILQFLEIEKPEYVAMITYDHKNHPKCFVSVTETVVYHAHIPVLAVSVNSAAVEDKTEKDLASSTM
ncbi:universal stress protein [Chryseolinea sp. H1M3-3]|uniref:universal stress protein n=1 Tax=Chryseolinea sp. H1M3-3 TaxID=3034144 RepID=UPI0023EBEEA3|nr:universal stress protein [Chryseolinea sp. H1M3-3]